MARLNRFVFVRSRVGDWSGVNRGRSLLALGKGLSFEEVAEIFSVTVQTLRNWLVKFVSEGPKSLEGKVAGGRPPRLTKSQKGLLGQMLEYSPSEYGYAETCWSLALVQCLVKQEFGVTYSHSQLSRIIADLGLAFKKPSFKFSKRNEENRRKWLEENFSDVLVRCKAAAGALIFVDEVGMYSAQKTSRTLGRIGQRVTVPHPGQKYSTKIIGGMDITNDRLTWHQTDRLNTKSFIEFLRLLKRKYGSQKIFLILDNVRYHRSKDLIALKESTFPNITFEYLPAYSPDFNPIEKLWDVIKSRHINNFFARSKRELVAHVRKTFRSISQKMAHHKTLYSRWSKMWDLTERPHGRLREIWESLTNRVFRLVSKLFPEQQDAHSIAK